VTARGTGGGGDFIYSPSFLLPQRISNRTEQHLAQRAGIEAREAMRRNGVRS